MTDTPTTSAPQAPAGGEASEAATAAAISQMLTNMQSQFEQMAGSVTQRIDELGGRLDGMEEHINTLSAFMRRRAGWFRVREPVGS